MRKTKINQGWQFWKDGQEQKKQDITLPHDAMILEARQPDLDKGNATGFYPGGKYIYEKKLYGETAFEGRTVLVEFEGVYMKSRVTLNGEEIGGWVYGYTNFYVDLSGKLNIGADNVLRVEVDNSLTPNSRWYSGSGIYRDVNLYIGDQQHIVPDGIKVKTVSYDPAVVEISVDSTMDESCEMEIGIFDGDRLIEKAKGSQCAVTIPNAKLWNAEEPNLYRAVAVIKRGDVELDHAECRFGIRKLEWDAQNGLRVNGKIVKLKGGCVHHDHGPLGARSYAKAEYRRLKTLKDLGYNSIRYSHNPTSRVFLDICDELGLYVLDETFDQWKLPQSTYDYAIYFDAEWKKDVEALVKKDYSHPSVIMYCVGNEITDTGLSHGALICGMISGFIKSMDDTRPTTIAINSMLSVLAAKMAASKQEESEGKTVGSAEVNDLVTLLPKIRASITPESLEALIGECVKQVDIVGYNYGENLYEGTHALVPDRVILSTETFPRTIGQNWPMVESTPWVTGDFMWTAWDYLGEAGVGQPMYGTKQAPFSKSYPCQSADIGAVDLTGLPETFAYYVSILWGVYKKPYIGVRPVNHSGEDYTLGMWRMTDTQHSWAWAGCEGRTAEIEVYSPGERVELILNGKAVGSAKPEVFKCSFEVPYEAGELLAIAYDETGAELGRDVLCSAGEETVLTILPEDTSIRADGEDLAYIAIHVTDQNGVRKMLNDVKINVQVEGAGVLEAVGSAQPETEERFDSDSYTSYYGRMIAIVRSTGTAGAIHVTASANGMNSVAAEIQAV